MDGLLVPVPQAKAVSSGKLIMPVLEIRIRSTGSFLPSGVVENSSLVGIEVSAVQVPPSREAEIAAPL